MSKPARITPVEQLPGKQFDSGWRRWLNDPRAVCLLLAIATLTAFWPVVYADFINYDDTDYVTSNPQVQAGLSWKGVTWAFTTNHASNWHPLTWLSHMLDVTLFGKKPTGPHCINLLCHTVNVLLLFSLLKRLTGALWRSALVASLFALHPLHVESVAWLAERKDVLSTLFGLLTLLAYARYAEGTTDPNQKSKRFYGAALATFALGLMSKPMLVTWPFVMLLLDYWPLRRFEFAGFRQQRETLARLGMEKIPFLLLSVISCGLTIWAQQRAIQPLEHLPMTQRWANAFVAYGCYLEKALWPVDLALPYLHPGHWPAMQVAIATIAVTGICLGVILTARTYPYLLTGWFWYLGTLVPVIGLVQVGAQAMADRYTYVPLIGVFIIFAWGGAEVCLRWRLPTCARITSAILILLVCGSLTRRQAQYWRDSETLFAHAAAVTKDNFVALGNIGGVLFERGKLEAAMDFYLQSHHANPRYPEALNSIGAVLAAKGQENEAMEWFRKALLVQPTHPDALFNMGNAMVRVGNTDEAIQFFQAAIRIKPDNYEARNNLGNSFAKLGRIDDAIVQYESAVKYKPDAAVIRKNLGEMLAAKGKLDEAVAQYRQVLAYTNDAGTHYSLGLTLAIQGKWSEAVEHYTATLHLSPTNADAHYNLGYALRTQGQLDQAAMHLTESIRLKPKFALAHFNLGCVLADKNEREQAIVHLHEALRLKPDYPEAQEKLNSLVNQTGK